MHWRQEKEFDLFTIKKSNKIPETMFLSIAQKILKRLVGKSEFKLLHSHLHDIFIQHLFADIYTRLCELCKTL